MHIDFHYYAAYCAAILAGYNHEESLSICYSSQFVDVCTKTLLTKIKGPADAATTQLQLELADTRTDLTGLQDITRIWASFHFLPYDLYAVKAKRTKRYMHRYRLICRPNSDLLVKTVNLARGSSLQHAGIAMHILADTWAHAYFAGTPSLVINNTTGDFYEIFTDEDGNHSERQVKFRHNPGAPDDLDKSIYTNTVFQPSEHSIMNLGHGRAGHLPDYSFARYRYLPAWNDYNDVIKDNPAEYMKAFTQMVYALRFLRGDIEEFSKDTYDTEAVAPYTARIGAILNKRQPLASDDWKALGEELSGETIEDFDIEKYQDEYINAPKDGKDDTFLGTFINAAMKQKGMVTKEILDSGNYLAGFVKLKSLSRRKAEDHD